MKKDRREINAFLEEILAKAVTDKKVQQDVMTRAYHKYGMSMFRAKTILSMGASIAELKDVEIYWILDCLNDKHVRLSDWFTDAEISLYSKLKNESNQVKFPIVLSALQVTDSQWISVVSAKELVKWRGHILRYNKEIQRRLAIKVRGGIAYRVISLKEKAITAMVNLFIKGKFIPNTITVNLPDDADFYYDAEKKELIISSLEYFDLTDGYHRLVALTKAVDADPNFNYPMELRLTCFSDDQAVQFIWQEEQHTPIPKDAIKSYNLSDITTKIVRRINESSCNLAGRISNGGAVDFSAFANMINEDLIKKMSDDEKKKALATVPRDLERGINAITDEHTELLDDNRIFTIAEVRIFAFCICKYYGKPKDDRLIDLFNILWNYEYKSDQKKILNVSADRYAIKLLREVSGYV